LHFNPGRLPDSTVYSRKMLLYAITGRRLLPVVSERERQAALVALARDWARGGVDYIQVREKDLSPANLRTLTCQIVAAARRENTQTRILLNGPAEIALEAGADGVHLPGSSPAAALEAAQNLYRQAGIEPAISQACHSIAEIQSARDTSLILFAPVFEKKDPGEAPLPGQGLAALSAACRAAAPVPVLALGGVTPENAAACIAVGAAGIAAIRLFLGDDWRGLR
jgi:thiamine-phosphate pyrophosphorylase